MANSRHVPPDECLVALCANGAANAFEELVVRHNAALKRFLLHLTKNPNDAEELAQETFIKAWQKLRSFDNRASFKSWLYSIGNHLFLDSVRQKNAQLKRETSWLQIQPNESFGQIENDKGQLLAQILAMFTGNQALMLELFYGEEFSHLEIANIMKLPLGTVKSNIARARLKIIETLAEHDKGI